MLRSQRSVELEWWKKVVTPQPIRSGLWTNRVQIRHVFQTTPQLEVDSRMTLTSCHCVNQTRIPKPQTQSIATRFVRFRRNNGPTARNVRWSCDNQHLVNVNVPPHILLGPTRLQQIINDTSNGRGRGLYSYQGNDTFVGEQPEYHCRWGKIQHEPSQNSYFSLHFRFQD